MMRISFNLCVTLVVRLLRMSFGFKKVKAIFSKLIFHQSSFTKMTTYTHMAIIK